MNKPTAPNTENSPSLKCSGGAEMQLESYAETNISASQPWQPPTSRQAGWKGLSAEQLHELAADEHASGTFVSGY